MDLLLHLAYSYSDTLRSSGIVPSLQTAYQVLSQPRHHTQDHSIAPYLRFKLAKILVLVDQHAPVAQQLSLLCSLLQASFATTNPFERLVALHNTTMLLYSSSQLFSHRRRCLLHSRLVEEYDQALPVLGEAITSLVEVVRQVTADCVVTANAVGESNELLAFCSLLLFGIRGWYATLFAPHVQTLVRVRTVREV